MSDSDYAEDNMGCIHLVSEYCEKHGYKHIAELPHFPDIAVAYQKPHIILKYLHNFDYVVWFDIDAAFINTSIRIEDIINLYPERDIFYFDDIGSWKLNAGVLIIKNSFKSTDLIWQWWNHCPKRAKPDWRKTAGDQSVLIEVLEKNPTFEKVLPMNMMNSHPLEFKPGDFVVHFMGYYSGDVKYHMDFIASNSAGSEWNGKYIEAFAKIQPDAKTRNLEKKYDVISHEDVIKLML